MLDSSKLKEFADNNFKSDENGRKFLRWVENTVGKGEIAHYEQFLLFRQCFQKTCKSHSLFGKGLNDGVDFCRIMQLTKIFHLHIDFTIFFEVHTKQGVLET